MDDMLASILKDLEFAEKSLQSSTHLLDDDLEPITSTIYTDSLTSAIFDTTRSQNEDINKHSSEATIVNSFTSNQQELKLCVEPIEMNESAKLDQKETNLIDDIVSTVVSSAEKTECELDQSSLVTPSNTQNYSQGQNYFKIPLPSTNPYINFVQDFMAKITHQEVTTSVLVAQAAAKWRKMDEEERKMYKNNGKNCAENKQLVKLKDYIRSMQMSEEYLFNECNF